MVGPVIAVLFLVWGLFISWFVVNFRSRLIELNLPTHKRPLAFQLIGSRIYADLANRSRNVGIDFMVFELQSLDL